MTVFSLWVVVVLFAKIVFLKTTYDGNIFQRRQTNCVGNKCVLSSLFLSLINLIKSKTV